MFDQMFTPEFINAGFMSMAENDINGRVRHMCDTIKAQWGMILPSSRIIDEALMDYHLDYWILPEASKKMIDEFDIME